MSEPDPDLELLQFRYSHYNEKARWGLDWKGLPHRRTSLLPGPHMPRVKRLTGQTMVPVLRIGKRCVAGSAAILDALERLRPAPSWLPDEPSDRDRALEIQAFFDDEIGAPLRRAMFTLMIDSPDYVVRVFAGQRPWLTRALYRASFPLVAGAMGRAMQLDDAEAVKAGFAQVQRGLDFVAENTGPEGYLAGPRFSVADLAAAAILAPAVDPPGSPMERPRPMPPRLADWLEENAAHPGADWVREIYRKHRPASTAREA